MKNNKIPNIYDENNNTVQKNAPEIVFNPDTEQQTITLTDAINNFLDTVFCVSSLTLFKFKDLPQLDFDTSEIKASVETEYNKYCNIQKNIYEKYFNYQFLKYYLDIDYASKITTDRLNTDKSLQDYICSLSIDVIINIVMYCLTHERKQALIAQNAQYVLNSDITNNIRDLLDTNTKCGALDIKSLIEYLKLIKRYAVNSITNKIVNIDSGNEQNLTDFVKNNTDKTTFNIIKVKDTENGITYEKVRNKRSQRYVFNNEFSTFYKSYKDGFMFNPYNPCTPYRDTHRYFRNKDFYNIYKPPFTKIVPDTDFKHLDKIKWQFDVYQEMIRVVCGYDDNYIKWLNDYIAQLVQKPYERMPYVLVLYSGIKQIGKSYIVSIMLTELLRYTTNITHNFGNIHGQFNSVISKTVLQYKNEITIFDNGKNELTVNKEKIKELSTSETAYVADKNVKGKEETRVYMHYVITTNNLRAIPIERCEQRFVVIQSLTDECLCNNNKGNITYNSYNKYKELLNEFEMNLKTIPNFASEFYQYCFNFYTKRQIDVDFAHMYNKFDFILKTNQELRNEIYTCYADVVRDAIETMHNDLIVDDKISLPTKLRNDLNAVLKEIDNRTYNNQNIQFYFNKITNSYYSAKEFNVLWVYIRYLLESNPNLYDNDEFNTSYIKRGEATQDARMLGRYLKEFSECYPEVLKCKTKTKNNASKNSKKQTFNTYMLNPKYAELLDL